jgi:hypothetical protein
MPTSKIWSQQLLEEFSDAVSRMIVGVTAPVSDPRDKHALYLNTGAIAGDMESHIVATVGASHRLLPVAATRVITEPAKRGLSACAVAAMRPNGTTNIAAMISSALKPREIPALFQTALDALVARATLVRGRRLLGPVLSRVTLPGTWNPPSGSRCCAPNVLVEINGHQVVPFSGASGMEQASGRGAGKPRRLPAQAQTTKNIPRHALSPTDQGLRVARPRAPPGLPQWLRSPAAR